MQMGDAKRRSEVDGCLTQPSYHKRTITQKVSPRHGAEFGFRKSDSQCLMKIAALCRRLASVLQSAACQTLRTGVDHRETTLDSTHSNRNANFLSCTIDPCKTDKKAAAFSCCSNLRRPRSRLQQHASIVKNAGKGLFANDVAKSPSSDHPIESAACWHDTDRTSGFRCRRENQHSPTLSSSASM